MNKIHFKITEDGIPKLTPIQRSYLADNAGKMAFIDIPKQKRTLSQNRYYWLYLNVIEIETGNNSDDLNEFFKRKLLPPKFVIIKGKTQAHELKIPKSTTELDKIEMGEFLDKISALTGVPLPDPKSAGYITNY